MKSKKVRTRFAPSPTGFLHIGGLRTALYSFLFAKQNNGDFILRIEDTDRSRFVENSIDNLISSLKWAGLNFDEGYSFGGEFGPYLQSQRLDIYQKYIKILLENNKAYYCFCSKQRLDKLRQEQQKKKIPPKYDGLCRNLTEKEINKNLNNKVPYVVRLKLPENEDIEFEDIIRGKIRINTKDLDDQVLLKSDGFPTYHFAVVVDDYLMKITHIIRGEEWLPSTPKHILLYKFFNWEVPKFAHLPLLLNKDRTKLSKRQNDVSVEDYRLQGYLPEALINFVALLGWNPGNDQEIFSLDELLKYFDLYKVHKSGAVFNREKLDWMNGVYIRKLSDLELYKRSVYFFSKYNLDKFSKDYILDVINLEKTRVKTLKELADVTDYFFIDKITYNKDLLKWKKGTLEQAKDRLEKIYDFIYNYDKDWTLEALESAIKRFIQENELGVGDTLWPLRVALCGKKFSPSPFEIMAILGKQKVLERVQDAIKVLSN